ncbi:MULTISPECIES: hypothetical protein [unclassified Rhodococcus (in: high G+C Gram-positive bacteria)]|uniref:hypothetical protein n=1 Tax=unclassified Rhodococcus (in: high G+C Gram-positive bacteria) TaxID=192944 RepID=UPI0020788836|nr:MULTISPECIES: hypothetical protein [unclassified Rhodococcus (in: high G+C Gram-positive bacteria)]
MVSTPSKEGSQRVAPQINPDQSSLEGITPRSKIIIAVTVVFAIAAALIITALRQGPVLGSADFTMDPVFKIPVPPQDTPYMSMNNIIATSFMTLAGLIGVGLGIRELRKTGSFLPLMLALSGAMICIPEVFYDVIGAVYFPWSETNHAFTILGREMPWWIVAGWFGYGAFMIFIYKLLESNPRTKTIWLMWAGAAASSVIFEEILLNMGVYHYYGNQPLIILTQLPWWWIPCNSVGVFLAAAIAYRYRERLRGWKSVSMLLITPLSVTAVYGFIAMPSWIAVNGNYPWLPTQLLGMLTIALGVAVFAFILETVLGRHPFRPNYVPATAPSPRENSQPR